MDEVDEGITHVAVVSIVDRQVEEVVSSAVVLVDGVKKHLLIVLVRNVPDHERSLVLFS